jgi:methylenetetrahydrofolate reductase (NADPH)
MTAVAALAAVSAERRPEAIERIVALMNGFSVEATRPSDADIASLKVLRRGTRVYLSAVPGRPSEEAIAAAKRLRAAGFKPVPHVAVRNFQSAHALDDFVARLNGEADVQRVLVIAGDREPCGPFRSAADAIDSGLFRRRGMRALGIAGYPQGHPRIGDDQLFRVMTEKIAAAEATGLAVEIVTQFCFDARAILDFIARLRAFGFDQSVRIGLAGPTSIGSLLRYASRCGVQTSAQTLARRAGLLRQMFALTVPDDLIRTLADTAPANVSAHFFSFGGVPATARWTRAVADGRIILNGSGGFGAASPDLALA